jgi:hypothetical protein
MKLIPTLALLATALPARGGDDAVTAKLAEVRTPRGVCASELQGAAVAAYVRPEVCIRVGSPSDRKDRRSWLFVDIETDGKHDADVRQWNVTVTGPGGKVLAKKVLAGSVIKNASCSIAGCANTYTALAMPPWKKGTYKVELVHSEDAEVASTFTIRLQ